MTTEQDGTGALPDDPRSIDSGVPGPNRELRGTQNENHPQKKGLLAHPILLISTAMIFIVVLVVALVWWLHARHFESTDDAFVDAHIVRLAPQIGGRVTAVLVDDNQLVQVGQPLLLIDSMDLQTRVAQAQAQRAQGEAQVENAVGQIRVNQASYRQARADAAAAAAQAKNAEVEFARYKRLRALNPAAVAQQQFDQAQFTAAQTAAQRDAAVRASQVRAAELEASRTQVVAGRAVVRAAQAQLDEASINLGYTRLVAPIAGHVTQKSVAVGAYVQPGTEVLAIVPTTLYVTANFKETQLALMRPGQPVTINVDACPNVKVDGHVDSIQRGAGQAFGILPPENATGNYVKVVQRVPVKITLNHPPSDCVLGPGMSVEPDVRVR
jgi:membrane fusion protein (multidrug efflux system)